MDLNTVEAIVPADRSALEDWRPGDAWLAGGTWLFSEPQPELRRLIDLTAFGWPRSSRAPKASRSPPPAPSPNLPAGAAPSAGPRRR